MLMKKILLFAAPLALMSALVLYPGIDSSASANGAPAARTGSPGDNNNCTSCHSGSAASITGAIVSDVPSSGYINGATYNFSATISGGTNYGFEISPQTNTGALVGTLINGSSGSKLISTSKYITHTSPATGASKTWTFQWKAPATGVTTAVFYGAFIVGNGNNQDTGDQCKLTSYTVMANTTGISEAAAPEALALYPCPADNVLSFHVNEPATAARVFNLQGLLVKEFRSDELAGGSADLSGMAPGVYYFSLSAGHKDYYAKFIKN